MLLPLPGQPFRTATKKFTGEPLGSSLVTQEFPMSYWPAVKYFLLVWMLLELVTLTSQTSLRRWQHMFVVSEF